jgi:hypothetical protein
MASFDNITSYSEKFLLNSTILTWICPSNCEETKITRVTHSAFNDIPKEFFQEKIKTGYWHAITKPLKAVFRTSVIGIIILTISPIGMCYHGSLALGNFLCYSVKKIIQGESKPLESWNKTLGYANAFFTDGSCFLIGAPCISAVSFGGYAIYGMAHSIVYGTAILNTPTVIANLALLSLVIGGASHYLGADSPSEYLARMLGNSDRITRIYYALEMRNLFGLVAFDGNLLKFSKIDELEFTKNQYFTDITTFTFSGHAFENLRNAILHYEEKLIEYVACANKRLNINQETEIPFTYPFKAQEVIKILEKVQKKKAVPDPLILGLISKIKEAEYGINSCKHVYKTSCEIAMKGSFIQEMYKSFWKNGSRYEVSQDNSVISNIDYKNYYNYYCIRRDQFNN